MRAVTFSYSSVNKIRFIFLLIVTALVSKTSFLTSSQSFMNLESIYYVEKTALNFFHPSVLKTPQYLHFLGSPWVAIQPW
ncbi:hypothetical protein KY290_021829 [Solanum tuberosum]|uniref:Uncharacterized protein n=1 Tax=Solanum tuberosum TaxID=4113 RepID=A0ABQ7V2P7_SOLTU|nr:hypothetical protein KY290_021829 [Solanum tuberosum]